MTGTHGPTAGGASASYTAHVRAMLVTAGLGTRLRPLTDELPKPAVPVGHRPIAAYALELLQRLGVCDVVANTHHLPGVLERVLEPHVPAGVQLTFRHEPQILGTGGGLRAAWAPSDSPFIAINGKVLYAPDLQAALRQHQDSGAIATMVLQQMPAGGGFAPVEVDSEHRIRRIRGQPGASDPALRACLYTGIQILAPRAHGDLPANGDLIDGAYRGWLERGERVQGFLDPAPFFDVGITPGHYLRANLALLDGTVRWPRVEPDLRSCLCAATAQVSRDAQLKRSVIGAGAQVASGVRITDSVVWPGARVDRDLHRAIVTTRGALVEVAPP